jgi:hypothetical protein
VKTISLVAAVALITLFLSHTAFLCQIHSDRALEANGLQKLLQGCNKRAETDIFALGMAGYVSSSVADEAQPQQAVWTYSKTLHSKGPIDSAFNTGILLASCAVCLCSCFYLADSLGPASNNAWVSRPVIGYVIAPVTIGSAHYAAAWLHVYIYGKGQAIGESLKAACASSLYATSLVLPLCVIAEWTTSSATSALRFDPFQSIFLAVSVLLPALMIYRRSDDWYGSFPSFL